MPVPEERLHNPHRLNRWFAVSSVLMTLSILWMIKVDYERPWREIQDQYFVGKAALAHLEYLQASTQEKQQELEEARQRLADAKEYMRTVSGPRRQELLARLEEVSLEHKKAEGAHSRNSQLLDVTRDTYEKMLGRHGPDHPRTKEAHAELLAEEAYVEELRKTAEHWGDQKRRIEAELKEIEEPVREAEKRLRAMEMEAEEALEKDQEYRGVLADEGLLAGIPIVKTLINMPILDYAAPKNTPGRQQINQLVLPDVRQELNYLETYTTDRCTTCHVAIDDPDFSRHELARKLERSLPAINEALQRAGFEPYETPPPPMLPNRPEPLPAGRVTEFWDELDTDQRKTYFETLLSLLNDYLERTGRTRIELGQPLLAHPNLDLYVAVDSAHPKSQMGCTVCHEGNPQETDFVQAAHTPPTHEIREEWEEKYYIRLLGVPNVTFETVEHHWERPMRLPRYTEAGCAKCHQEITDIARFEGERVGSRINLGRHLFETVGCVNCHDVDAMPNPRKVGPDLTYVAEKLDPEFVEQWVFFPQEFRPSTRMPHFFLQENNLPESANAFDQEPVLRTETEVAAMTRYLFSVSREWEPIEPPDGVSGDAERGRDLFRNVGCLACHANIAEFGEEWIPPVMARREGVDEETARFRYRGMTQEERIRYAMKHFVNERESFLKPEVARFEPESEDATPVLTRFAPELSGIGSKVDFEWLYSWLMEPTHYTPDTKMPSLRLSPREAADIAAYLLTLKNDRFEQGRFDLNSQRLAMADDLLFSLLSARRSERHSRAIMNDEQNELTDMLVSLLERSLGEDEAVGLVSSLSLQDKKLVYLGNKMIGHYGCYACHRIPGFEDTTPPGTDLSAWAEKPIAQIDFAFYDDAFEDMREEKEDVFEYVYPLWAETLHYWSPLGDRAKEQITHTHAAFAKHKMLNPRIWDREKIKSPYDKLKMPNFYFTKEEAEALTTYLLSRVPGRVSDALKVDYEDNPLGPIAEGRQLTRELNCVGCHQIEDNAPPIQQYFTRKIGGRIRFDDVNAPPRLWGEGAKVQHNWLHQFFQHVEPLRPWLQVRMPSFHLTGDEATTLVEYFAALSRRHSQKLAAARDPVMEYIERQRERVAGASEAGDEAAPGSDWYARDSLEDAADFLTRWAVERELVNADDLDPLETSVERLRAAHADVLERTGFLQQLYDVEYPFVEPPTPLSSEERVERGRRFFNDMGCLQCHVLGDMLSGPAQTTDDFVQMYRLDAVQGEGGEAVAVLNGRPYPVGATLDGSFTLVSAENIYYDTGDVETKAVVEGPGPSGESERVMLVAPSAPNLSLTYQRLRRKWVFDWMLEPQWIQPGTKMPQNFPDGRSPFEGMPEYPGTGTDHINLLVDFLYHAGATNARAPLPKIVVQEQAEEFEEGGDEFFEEEFFEEDFD